MHALSRRRCRLGWEFPGRFELGAGRFGPEPSASRLGRVGFSQHVPVDVETTRLAKRLVEPGT
jgi:hypothetical protein